jgi:hypothetical protein
MDMSIDSDLRATIFQHQHGYIMVPRFGKESKDTHFFSLCIMHGWMMIPFAGKFVSRKILIIDFYSLYIDMFLECKICVMISFIIW